MAESRCTSLETSSVLHVREQHIQEPSRSNGANAVHTIAAIEGVSTLHWMFYS